MNDVLGNYLSSNNFSRYPTPLYSMSTAGQISLETTDINKDIKKHIIGRPLIQPLKSILVYRSPKLRSKAITSLKSNGNNKRIQRSLSQNAYVVMKEILSKDTNSFRKRNQPQSKSTNLKLELPKFEVDPKYTILESFKSDQKNLSSLKVSNKIFHEKEVIAYRKTLTKNVDNYQRKFVKHYPLKGPLRPEFYKKINLYEDLTSYVKKIFPTKQDFRKATHSSEKQKKISLPFSDFDRRLMKSYHIIDLLKKQDLERKENLKSIRRIQDSSWV